MSNNRASVHITQPGITKGFDDFLLTAAQAGNPVPVVYSLNGSILPSILKCSPTTQVIYRRQSSAFSRLPDKFFVEDPVVNATRWLTIDRDRYDKNRTQIENWRLNPATWYDPLNEPAPGTPAQAQWLNTWMITALDIAAANNFKLALFSFPTGCPDFPLWPYLFPALRKGAALGAVLSLHEYSIEGSLCCGQARNVLRYRDVYDLLPPDCRMPIVVSECGAGNGYDTGLSGQAWVDDLMWYNSQCCQDDYLLGFCAFQLGGGESNMVEALPAYGRAIAGFHCPNVIPAQESANGTTIPIAAQIMDHLRHTWQFGIPDAHGRQIIRDGGQFAGGQGVLLLYYGQSVYTQNDIHEWYVATETAWSRIPGDPRIPPQPTGTIYYGLGAGMPQDAITSPQAGIYGTAFGADSHAAFKFLTLPDSTAMISSIARIRARNPGAFLMTRLFFSVGNTRFTPQDFVAYCHTGMLAAYQAGLRDFEVHNEPNLESEGMGLSWIDGYTFGAWLKETLIILRAQYPEAQFWFPGLSPNGIAPIFMSQALATPGLCALLRGYCFHSYWQTESDGAWNMTDESGGLSWRKVWRVLPATEQAKLRVITEFSNNSATVQAVVKGQQYRRYRALLQQNGVYAAFSFVLYWDGDRNKEAWSKLNGSSTGILEGYKT